MFEQSRGRLRDFAALVPLCAAGLGVSGCGEPTPHAQQYSIASGIGADVTLNYTVSEFGGGAEFSTVGVKLHECGTYRIEAFGQNALHPCYEETFVVFPEDRPKQVTISSSDLLLPGTSLINGMVVLTRIESDDVNTEICILTP